MVYTFLSDSVFQSGIFNCCDGRGGDLYKLNELDVNTVKLTLVQGNLYFYLLTYIFLYIIWIANEKAFNHSLEKKKRERLHNETLL